MNIQTIKQAFYKSILVLAGYVVLGIGFGILMRNAGYGVLWAASMSILFMPDLCNMWESGFLLEEHLF